MTLSTAQRGFSPLCAVVVFAACTGSGAPDSAAPVADTPPAITEASATCDSGEAEWAFEVVTDAWTGNGQVLLSTDGEYVEKHPLYSRVAAPDGTRDELGLALDVVPDWRDVVLGGSTVFNCGAPDLTGILRVWTRDGTAEADCRAFGVSPERWADWDAGATCDRLLDTGD